MKFSGYNRIECGSGFQPRQLNSRLEAAPTESLSNANFDFSDKQVGKFYRNLPVFISWHELQ